MKTRLAIVGLAVIFSALGVDRVCMMRLRRFTDLARRYELDRLPANPDMDGDGVPGSVTLEAKGPSAWVVVTDSGRELARIPYQHQDRTARTHLAWRPGGKEGRFFVFDGGLGGTPYVRAVYRISEGKLGPAEASSEDNEILSALAAGDDWGTFTAWTNFQVLRVPVLAVLVAAGGLLFIRSFRAS